jgi:hypothetical protein
MASDGIAVLLKVLLGSLLLVTVNGESVVCDKDRPATHELSKNEKSLRFGLTVGIWCCCMALQYSRRLWGWLMPTTEIYFVPHVILLEWNLRLGGNSLAQMVSSRVGMIERLRRDGLVDYYLRLFSLVYQILKSVDGKTYWLSVARMAGLVVIKLATNVSILFCGNLWSVKASFKLLGKKCSREQRADRRIREAWCVDDRLHSNLVEEEINHEARITGKHPDQVKLERIRKAHCEKGLHPDEVNEAFKHRCWLCVQVALYTLVIASYTVIFWLIFWPRYNHIEGCRNVTRMIVTYLVVIVNLLISITLTLQLLPLPPVVISDKCDRGYLGTTNLPMVLAQVGYVTISIAIDMWILLRLIHSNVSDATFWLQWTATAWAPVVLCYTRKHQFVRIWPGILPPDDDGLDSDWSAWRTSLDAQGVHPLLLPPFNDQIYHQYTETGLLSTDRDVYSPYSDQPSMPMDITDDRQVFEVRHPLVWGEYTTNYASFHTWCCCFSSFRKTPQQYSCYLCMGTFAYIKRETEQTHEAHIRCCYCFRKALTA